MKITKQAGDRNALMFETGITIMKWNGRVGKLDHENRLEFYTFMSYNTVENKASGA